MNGHLVRAEEALESARLLFEAGKLAGAANRVYYAFFHAAQAAVAKIAGIDPRTIRTHQGLRRLFDLHVVKAGLMDTHLAADFGSVASTRIVADYGDEPLQGDEVEHSIRRARDFVDACRHLSEGSSHD
jgi:uncharacterized protein (UPF0332 family)